MILLSDIDLSISELNVAINHHHDWASRMLHFSLLGGTPDDAILHPHAHEKCGFSRWFTRFEAAPSRYQQRVEAIYTSHITMHTAARDLLISIIHKDTTEELVQHYHLAQQRFITAIDSYKQALITFRNMHDTLTGLPLRHLLFLDFDHLRADPATSATLWLLMLDIDRFKSINDTWGHNAGDDVLRSVAATLEAQTACCGRLYRFGGEEFIVLLNASTPAHAAAAARAIQHSLTRHPITLDEQTLSVTVTGGLTQVRAQDTLHSAIARADSALYAGKNGGRNCCVMANAHAEMTLL